MGLEGGEEGQLGMLVMEGDVLLVVDDDCSAGLHGWVPRRETTIGRVHLLVNNLCVKFMIISSKHLFE